MEPVTIAMLFYGDYPALAERLLTGLAGTLQPAEARIRIGMNCVCEETRQLVQRFSKTFDPELVIDSPVNLYKIGMTRKLLRQTALSTEWTIWFDDDSFPYRSDWLRSLRYQIQAQPSVDMWGLKLFTRMSKELEEFLVASPWHRGLPFLADDREKYRVAFIAGGFWALRSRWLETIDWPDPRVLQFGEDYILGEALRQNGARFGSWRSGVAINQAATRAPAGTPRGGALW